MNLVRVGASILNQTPLAWDGNRRNILDAITDAREQGVSILCLPELCITGYGCEDAFHSPGVWRLASDVLSEIVPETVGIIVSVGLPVYHRGGLHNAACLLVDGQIAGFVAKRFLAGDGLHYEPRWFNPWPAGVVDCLELDGQSYPLGDTIFDCGGVRIGFEICEDAWVADRPGVQMALSGLDLILNPSASHFAFGKIGVRKRFVLEGSRAFGVSYVYSNLVGNEAGRAIYDGGALIATAGTLVATGSRFSFRDVELTTALVDIDHTRMTQVRTASFQPDLGAQAAYGRVAVAFEFPNLESPALIATVVPDWEQGVSVKQEEFTRAISLALFDYLRKSRSRGFVVSLSGGADSSAVACLVRTMVELAVRELGTRGFAEKLGNVRRLGQETVADIVCELLKCVYQSTSNSSTATLDAARELANAIGAEFHHFDVEAIVRQYTEMVSESVGRELAWETDDVALQNIQARVRAPGVWLLANLAGSLLLSTSNRSEAAVGYATMDGDTCGGISPIAGIDKAFLLDWLSWMEHSGPKGLSAIPALGLVNALRPTAELRPSEQAQTDEGDLMPYPVLDAIERAAIRDKHTPLEVVRTISIAFPKYQQSQIIEWTQKFFRLWSQNQWKRERYAPSFHVDDENLDPKTWCRFPILSGGFARELAELNAIAPAR